MQKALRILLALTIVGSLFAVGFAGTAAADYKDKKKMGNSQSSWQYANSHVDQEQYVAQGNSNYQDDNYAVSAAGSYGGEAESGDAYAVQASYQSNKNSQSAYSNAQNWNEQEQE